ncbi:enoyl reductase [Tremella mesenterica]|uniref:Enoyl reductase n=1 Tax=Tremella mesenterica TaxID=5217 RepID=A0A4Q1BUL7_TREME|nr:enoyl reductase [Tremella mesenterica]
MVSLTVTCPGKPTIHLDFPSKPPGAITFVPARQRLTAPSPAGLKPVPLVDESKSLDDYGVGEGGQLKLKDLGRQVGYRVLYLWEYAGPVFLVPIWLRYSYLLWGKYEHSSLQIAVERILVLHFLKRFLESAFLHSFSRATLPLAYVFRNSLYYWGVCGLLIPLTLFRPAYGNDGLVGKWALLNSPAWVGGWSIFILITELLNFNAHVHLRSLRQPPGKPRKYPTGFGFGHVVCANYFFETLGVCALVIMTAGDFGTIVYLSIATFFMRLWSSQKYARYKKEFDPKVFPGKRWKMIPLVY